MAALDLVCGDPLVAEDIAQEVLVRVWDRWRRVRTLESPGGWAHHVAMNLARSHLRRRGAEQRAQQRHAGHGSPVQEAQYGDDSLRDALLALPLRDRQVVVLRHYLEYSVAETAAVLGVPEGTVKSTASRALGSLRRAMGIAGAGGGTGDG